MPPMSTSAASVDRHRGVTFVDIVMLVLALASVGLLIFVEVFPHSAETAYLIFGFDTAICGVFLVEFLFRWHRAGWERWFPLRHWYEVLGMIPVAHPALRGLRLLRVVVLVIRVVRSADRAFGERFTQRLVERLSRPIVLAIKTPITVAVLDEVVKVLETGNYPQNIARSLSENRLMLRAIVTEKLKEDQTTGRLSRLPFHDDIVHGLIDTTMRVIVDVLTDPRTDAFFAEVVRENRLQIREAVVAGLHEKGPKEATEAVAVP
ncbi:ion transporter [Pseudonocardia sp. GCM10023141]|uniref:ion transporter n=1 Tax=Pseudonocardia sp. GCM10023141 TaxID=3252653 RepID=UPI0036162DB7